LHFVSLQTLHKNIAINCVTHWSYPRFAQFNGIRMRIFVMANTAGPAGLHVLPFAMVDDRAAWRRKKREQLAELKSAAIAKLERRGYEVRGKTPGQIRQILKRRPLTQKSVPNNQRD
jgi:hypothetical protein